MADDLERAILAGAVLALRKAAAKQRDLASNGASLAGDRHPGVLIRSPEAACAANLADDWTEIALRLAHEMEGRQ